MKTNIYFWSYLTHFFLEWEVFQTRIVEKIKAHILCSLTFFKYCTDYDIMQKILQSWRGHRWHYVACTLHADWLICKHRLRISNTYWFSSATIVARMCLSVTLYIHCLSCFSFGGEVVGATFTLQKQFNTVLIPLKILSNWHFVCACNYI
jgi:hypothetical protein